MAASRWLFHSSMPKYANSSASTRPKLFGTSRMRLMALGVNRMR